MSDFGDRMKYLEKIWAGQRLIPTIPICARMDGRAFHTWTKRLRRPYDTRLSAVMALVTTQLVEETNALVGYCQSDEISLVWHSPDFKSQPFFGGKVQKMASILSSITTACFNAHAQDEIPEEVRLAIFDARVWNMPTETEAVNYLMWREQDAVRNSVQMLAQHYYSHKQLHGKHTGDLHEMIHQAGDNWDKHPAFFKRGQYVRRVTRTGKITPEELEDLPEKHEARRNPDFEFERSSVQLVDIPPVAKIINRVDVLLHGATPVLEARSC
jgi:tRNA(His) 5'-end guanylyltransferase